MANIASAEEPIVNAHVYTPSEYVGNIMELVRTDVAYTRI